MVLKCLWDTSQLLCFYLHPKFSKKYIKACKLTHCTVCLAYKEHVYNVRRSHTVNETRIFWNGFVQDFDYVKHVTYFFQIFMYILVDNLNIALYMWIKKQNKHVDFFIIAYNLWFIMVINFVQLILSVYA